jgi:hypothetical protein
MPSVSTPQHSRLINAAAKVVLRPLGCVQKGRSRTWLDDRVWWVGVVEFQPSSWAKGSYLNVGACWLWYEKDFLSFDAGYRVESFHPFTGNEAFELVAEKLAERASHEVTALRERFPSPSHVQSWIAAKPRTSIWDHYHLAVSAGLAGATDQSKRSFADVFEAERLHRAARDGDIEEMARLVASGVDMNLFDDISWTPLHYAVDCQHYKAAQWLLDNGSAVNAHELAKVGE